MSAHAEWHDWTEEDDRLFREQEQAAQRDPAVHVIRDAPSRWVGVPLQARWFFSTLCCFTSSLARPPSRGMPAVAPWTCFPGISRLVLATGASEQAVRRARERAREFDLIEWDPAGWRGSSTLYKLNWQVAARLAIEGKAEQDRLLDAAGAAERARVAERRARTRQAAEPPCPSQIRTPVPPKLAGEPPRGTSRIMEHLSPLSGWRDTQPLRRRSPHDVRVALRSASWSVRAMRRRSGSPS